MNMIVLSIYLSHAESTECKLEVLAVQGISVVIEMLGRCDSEEVKQFNLIYRAITTDNIVIMTSVQVESTEQKIDIFELPLLESEDGDMFSIQVTINSPSFRYLVR